MAILGAMADPLRTLLQRPTGPTPASPQRPAPDPRDRAARDKQSAVPFQFDRLAVHAPSQKLLRNPRFADNAELQAVVRGSLAIAPGHRGPAVHALQSALIAAGYSIPNEWRISTYGPETAEAVALFNRAHGQDGTSLSASALQSLDQEAPLPGRVQEHYVDYERLLADGRFDVTIAIGYESKPVSAPDALDERESVSAFKHRNIQEWLKSRKFQRRENSEQPGHEHYVLETQIVFPGRDHKARSKKVTVQVNLIVPHKGAAAQFERALNESELTLYTGHARGGMGPDFDEIRSALENFVVGGYSRQRLPGALNSHAAGVITRHVNDLERMTRSGGWDQQKYRVWFFNACTSLLYLRGIRGGLLPVPMDRQNLDVFGTTNLVPSSAGALTSLTFLDGILQGQSMEQIVASMSKDVEKTLKQGSGASQAEVNRRSNPFFREGAADNPTY